MSTALILSMHDLGEWSSNAKAKPGPGGSMPYGLQYLQEDFELTWSDAQRNGIWRHRIPRALGGAARRLAPGLEGSVGALYAVPKLQDADVVFSIFENAGFGFGRFQRLPGRGRHRRHVMLTCWLAEDCRGMTASQLRSVRRSIRSVSRIAVFSVNQVAILQEFLGVDPKRISVVPFGVDTGYYSRTNTTGPAGGGGLVAVGSDSRRDYATLFEAVRIANVPLTLVCRPRNITGLDVPGQVKVLSGVFNDDYRQLLLSADLVVTPTLAPAYPSGQSVVLEAMSMGRATLTTDSPAMRDYVCDGVDGILMPPGQPSKIAQLITGLLADSERRESIGGTAERSVRSRFCLDQMWRCISDIMMSEAKRTDRSP